MIRRALGLVGVMALLLAVAPASGIAQAPEGPRLAYIREGQPLRGAEILTVDPLGEYPQMLSSMPNTGLASRGLFWSSDGSQLALGGYGLPRERIVALPASGGRFRPLRGIGAGFNPVFSPDGRTVAFSRFRFRPAKRKGQRRLYLALSAWVDTQDSKPRQLTPWRNGLFIAPSSFSPDGGELAAVRETLRDGPQIVTLPAGGGAFSVVVENGLEPKYSPDGSAIAFVRRKLRRVPKRSAPGPVYGGDLFVASADGSHVRRLTFTPAKREEGPSWDPSGERLAFAQFPSKLTWEARTGIGSAIIEINADGTCRHRLLFTYGLSYWAPAWQPGPGREAGRIEC